jgi:outer membrane cobalamin receptor
MRSLSVVVSIALLVERAAFAQAPAEPAPAEPAPAEPELSAEDRALLEAALQSGDVIEIWGERPDKPFDRDTEVRLTGEELAARGATDLATALALLPDVSVRDVGRGGFNLDIRGARKGAVRVLIDGVSVSDPYYGNFDVSTIPITDIVQIRVSTAPSSPIDGPGGPGGVVEVHTRDAIGGRLIVGRMTSSSAPTFGASATGRADLARGLALRVSASSVFGLEQYDTATAGVSIEDDRRSATGAARLEYRDGDRRIALDAFADLRRYVSPPSDELASALILVVDRETTNRVALSYDDRLAADPKLQLRAQAWFHAAHRRSRNYRDAALEDEATSEDLHAVRTGGMLLATRPLGPRWRWVGAFTLDHERALVEAQTGGAASETEGRSTITEASAGGQFADGPLKLDAAAGLAAPIGIDGARPWPEGKLAARYRPFERLEVTAIGARKGRVPSLRERFEGADANAGLEPEMAWHGELRAVARPTAAIEVSAAPYYRRTTGTVRVDPEDGVGLVNLGELDVRGADLSAKARLPATVQVGGAYNYGRAYSEDLGVDPLDRFPKHRGEAWASVAPVPAVTALARARAFGHAVDRGMTTPRYLLCEASLTASLHGGDWLGVLRIDDLFDARPETRVGFRLPGRTFSLALQGTWD